MLVIGLPTSDLCCIENVDLAAEPASVISECLWIVRLAGQLLPIAATLSHERSANSDAQQGFRLDTLAFWHCSQAGNEAAAPTRFSGMKAAALLNSETIRSRQERTYLVAPGQPSASHTLPLRTVVH